MLTQAKDSECIFSKYECHFGLMCEGAWRQAGNKGFCKCDRLFGFGGTQCIENSAATYMCVTICFFLANYACSGLRISFRHALKYYGGDIRRMSRSTGGRILIFSFIMPACLFVCSLGFGLHALRVDRKLIFIRYFLQPTFGLIIAGYAGVTLSVSIFWLQVVEKAQRMSSGNKQTFACSYLGALVSVLSCVGILLVLVVLSWIYVRSNSMFPVLGALLQLMVSSFYRIARQRIKLVCDVMLLTISERIANGGNIPDIALHKVKEIAERVQDFASTMSWNFALLCTFFFIDGFHASSSETALRSSERATTMFVRADSRRLGVFKMNSFSNSLYI